MDFTQYSVQFSCPGDASTRRQFQRDKPSARLLWESTHSTQTHKPCRILSARRARVGGLVIDEQDSGCKRFRRVDLRTARCEKGFLPCRWVVCQTLDSFCWSSRRQPMQGIVTECSSRGLGQDASVKIRRAAVSHLRHGYVGAGRRLQAGPY